MSKNLLFQDFPDVSKDKWKDKIIADLKGADYQKKLVWRTDEGFEVQPFYTKEDLAQLGADQDASGNVPAGTRKENDWLIRQDLAIGNSIEECNRKIIQVIDKGAQSVGIDLNSREINNEKEMEILLAGVDTSRTYLNFIHAGDPARLYQTLVNYINSAGNKNNTLKGSLGFDPLGQMARTGDFNDTAFDQLAELVKQSARIFPHFRIIAVDAGLHQDSGSTLSQELGYGMAMAAEYMAQLTKRGADPEMVAASMSFNFSVGPDYFMEIAKLRAARSIWTAIYAEWNVAVDNLSMFIHSRTASWNLTVYDPNVNMLRITTEAMSASLGGSDEITVLPFDRWFNPENDFASRVAQNIQIILKEEAYFGKVADPATGSYFIEELTSRILDQAWEHFIETEEQNGYLDAFRSGNIQKSISSTAEKKREKAASRRQTILGVNQYPAFGELILNQDRSVPDNQPSGTSSFPALVPFRISADIEKLRQQTEKSGKNPKIFLLKYGDPAWRTARAMFAGNFFACGGFEIIDNAGFDDLQKGIGAAKKSNADIVVLCSADDAYATAGPAAYDALHESCEIVVAGYPKDVIDELKEKGIDHFIHIKSNLLEELKKFQDLVLS